MKCLSNNASYVGESSSPLFTSNLSLSLESVHGTICEAINTHQFFITLTEGRYHQIKQMVAACGNRVVSLHRLGIGAIELGDLALGEYRELTALEVSSFYD